MNPTEKTKKFYGGTYPAILETDWKNGMVADGFESIWHWLRWLAQRRINEQKSRKNLSERIKKIERRIAEMEI